MSDKSLQDFHAVDMKHKWFGAHSVSYAEFFQAMAVAYQREQNAPADALNQVRVKGPLAGMSGHDIKRLWEAP